MRKMTTLKRLLSVVLVLSVLLTWVLPANAIGKSASFRQVGNDRVSASLLGKDPVDVSQNQKLYADSDMVRVSIILEKAGTIEAGFEPDGIASNKAAMAYRASLKKEQASLVSKIEKATKEELDVVWNMTLAANLISANVKYGQIEKIASLRGVSCVVVEETYEPDVVKSAAADPNMATSGEQTGAGVSYDAGFTGAGSRVAIIDTGVDVDHLSFDAGAFNYSLANLAGKAGLDPDEFIAGLNLLDAEEIAGVLADLNVSTRVKIDAESLYVNSKIPFGFNYVDNNTSITHLKDNAGEHGSHVAGIAAANAYVPNADGSYSKALETVLAQGVAPDAQLIVMKVFGAAGGAYPSDYMVAIEDAILLNCDSVNLSLGSGNPGMTRDATAAYQAIMDSLLDSGIVVSMSAGNSGSWVDSSENGMGYLYADDVSMHAGGSPGTYVNSLGVASVDNAGWTDLYFGIGDQKINYYESPEYGNAPIVSIAGKHEYVFLNSIGTDEEFAALADVVAGKIALCYRGETSFFQKANAAMAAGAAGLIIVNNQPGVIYLNLTDYAYTAPVVSVTQANGEFFKENGTAVAAEDGSTWYWTGSMEISDKKAAGSLNSAFYTMSSFSSWGVPGSLILKPEITAPGGAIHSVGGAYKTGSSVVFGDHASYEVMSGTSMAAPQVAGMAALMAQYIREAGLEAKTGLDARTLAQSLLMSTAVPMIDGNNSGYYYPVLQQGAGLANVGAAVLADSYIMMGADATASYADGKVKVELGDDPDRAGEYVFTFTINNISGEEEIYNLSADFFIQAPVSDGYDMYMHKLTTLIGANVEFVVDGKSVESAGDLTGMDFNGDGVVNTNDGQALLDYAVGVRDSVEHADLADLDGDGDIDSHDAYLFLAMAEQSVVVPADGSVSVTVNVSLSDDWKATLDYYYPNGTYLQGYVYAESTASEEGVVGTSHSIPVLGFFGNWSDASMYDKGSYAEYAGGLETRAPYLYKTNFAKGRYNGILISYADTPGAEYWFGGNPYFQDAHYMPERDAISAANGDVLSTLMFTLIRNAAAAKFQLWNAETGEYYIDQDVPGGSPLYSAYYYVNGGTWKNTSYTLNLGLSPEGIPNNTRIEVGITAALEYYLDANGNVNWDALGEGATYSMGMTVDNEAPVLKDVSLNLLGNSLDVDVSDNQYIAAIALFDASGRNVLVAEGSDPDQKAGDVVSYALDLTDVNGSGFLLQAYDYAGNAVTYEINVQIGQIIDYVDSVEVDPAYLTLLPGDEASLEAIVSPANTENASVTWSSSDESVAVVDAGGKVTAVGAGYATITATSVADPTKSGSCRVEVITIETDMNAFVWNADGSIYYSSFNTADLSNLTAHGENMANLPILSACTDPDGNIYACSDMDPVTGISSVYMIDPVTLEATYLYDVDSSMFNGNIFYADMTWAPGLYGTGGIFIIYGPYVLALNVETGVLEFVDQYEGTLVGITTCYGTFMPEDNMSLDFLYLIQADGQVIQEGYVGAYDLQRIVPYSALLEEDRFTMETDISIGDSWYLNTAYYDGTYLYWSAIDYQSEAVATLYAIDADFGTGVFNLGQYSEDQWLATGLHQNYFINDESAAAEKMAAVKAQIAANGLPEMKAPSFEVMPEPAQPMSGATVGEGEKTVTVEVTVGQLAGAVSLDESGNVHTNGVSSVVFDSAALQLMSVVVNGDYTAYLTEDGKVTFGYVSLDGLADDAVVATLVFEVKDTSVESVEVTYKEVNNEEPGNTETIEIGYSHANTEVKDAKDPTCTEPGYTGDTYCTDCGKLIASGEEIPATGHQHTEVRDAKDPDCTNPGYTGDTYCTDCGEKVASGEEIPATGHQHTEVRDAKDPDCTNPGYTGDTYCTDCGEKVTSGEEIPAKGHDYEDVVTPPTTTEGGYTTHTCKDCGHSYVDSHTDPIPGENPPTGDGAFGFEMMLALATITTAAVVMLFVFKKKQQA